MPDDKNNPKMDLDLIQMVQRARMMNDNTAQPSDISAVYWIEAKAPNPSPTPRAGKWEIHTHVDEVDALWAKVKAATEAGELGYKSKVSTSPGKDQANANARIIHIRCSDSADEADLERVRVKLHEIGVADDAVVGYEAD
ncbi:MAG: putative phosphothreonine lyase domain-containing protein [Chloroflexota bacterium]